MAAEAAADARAGVATETETSADFAAGLAAEAAADARAGVATDTESTTGLAAKAAADARAGVATESDFAAGLAAKATTDTEATAGFTAKTPTDAVANLSAQSHRIRQLRAASQAGAEPSSSLTASRRRNVRGRRQTELTGHRLLQTNDGVAATKLQPRHRAGRHGGDLGGGHVSKPGIIQRLVGRGSEGPGRVFAAE